MCLGRGGIKGVDRDRFFLAIDGEVGVGVDDSQYAFSGGLELVSGGGLGLE